jgi:hypothetical protein
MSCGFSVEKWPALKQGSIAPLKQIWVNFI